ncbi:MAG: M20/M25/M40 family metallo-hydrolase [Legionella sp.]|nr:MAG: M20/M25/M40 family metallo-hydrolase [Legionella sp.]
MRFNQWITNISTGLVFASSSAFAVDTAPVHHEQLQVPQCLAAKITSPHQVLAEDKSFKIIDVLETDIDSLVILADKEKCGHFVNVSHKLPGNFAEQQRSAKRLLQKPSHQHFLGKSKSETYTISHQTEVEAALKDVVADNIWQTLTHLTTMQNRSATKETGVEAANWLKSSFESMATTAGRTDTTTFLVKTGWYKQPSVVTVIGKDIKAPAVVIGAHMDTLDGRMPGAGDDGSGSSTVMEIARVLLNSKTPLKHPVYIIWYAAEERGLKGSQYVVQHFLDNNIPVKAAIQFDMTGYRVEANDPTMWVFTDYTDKALSNFLAKLIDTYVKVPVDYSRCGYGCSDHASWHDEGIPAAFPCESNFEDHNPYIHSSDDTMDLLSLEHMTNFTKLGIAFAIELASD